MVNLRNMRMNNPRLISNKKLLNQYLTLPMEVYFYKKLPKENKQYIKLKIIELLKYLHLAHHTYGDIPFNDEIDDVWHLWILQTVQYQELIDKLPGKKFINHCSNDYADHRNPPSEEESVNLQISYLASYVANFGDFTSETIKFWPMTSLLMNMLNVDLAGLNDYLSNLVGITS